MPAQWSALHYSVDMHAHHALVLLLQGECICSNPPPRSFQMLRDAVLDTRVDVSCTDSLGRSAADLARNMGDNDALQLLIACGRVS